MIELLGTIASYSALVGLGFLAFAALIFGGFFIALLIGTAGI